MKKILFKNGDYMYIGTAREICSLYKNFSRKEIAMPAFCDFPKFNMGRYYGLFISYNNVVRWDIQKPTMQVVAGDTALALISECELLYS